MSNLLNMAQKHGLHKTCQKLECNNFPPFLRALFDAAGYCAVWMLLDGRECKLAFPCLSYERSLISVFCFDTIRIR